MDKIIRPDSFDFGAPTAKLVEAHSKGVDRGWIHKRAAMFDDIICDLKPEKGHTLIHVITTGAMETYGANANADSFNRCAREYVVPQPEKGCGKKIKLAGGLDEYHKLYTKNGYVYKNHKDNKNPDNASGKIVHECINDKLNRGELIISVENDKWHNEIENLSTDKPVMLSMGCSVKEDICTVCGHRRSRLPDACDHVKYNKLAITPDGFQVSVINDKPMFHDISGVVVPADKIAFALRKVASAGVIGSAELAEMEGYTSPSTLADTLYGKVFDKYATLVKLADIEKEIAAIAEPVKDAFTEEAGFGDVPSCIKEAFAKEPDKAFDIMRDMKVVLPLKAFLQILLKGQDVDVDGLTSDVKEEMPGIFERMLESDDVSETLKDGTFDGCPGSHGHLRSMFSSLLPTHSLEMEPVRQRTILSSMRGNDSNRPTRIIIMHKRAFDKEACEYIANEYAKYLIAFNRNSNDFVQRMSVVQKSV